MKLRSTYAKMLLSFLAVLFVTEILVFFLFIMVPARQFAVHFEEFAKSRFQVVKKIAEDKIRSVPDAELSGNVPLREFVVDVAGISGARVWLTGSDGRLLVKSFSGEIPDPSGAPGKGRPGRWKSFRRRAFGDFNLHTVIRLEPSGRYVGDLHLLFGRPTSFSLRGRFALGLALIGALVALAVVPVSRIVTRRIRQLRLSAALIAEGDLSHRVKVRGDDEISDLSRAFNDMADKIEGMIKGNRELTANISHELRAPLARIRVAEELLREKTAQGAAGVGDLATPLDGIREDIEELDGLIGRILDLSKLDMRQSPLEPELLDPSNLIRGLLERLRPVTEQKGLRVTTDLPTGEACLADRDTLRIALANVLDNAAKFTPAGGDISFRVAWTPERIEVRVANTSGEMSPEDLLRIFDPFYRSKRAGATGSGLGLTIARKAVERLGGTIGAAQGEGRFEITMTFPR